MCRLRIYLSERNYSMKKNLFGMFVFILFSFSLIVKAQVTVKGTVVDHTTKEPIQNAAVTTEGTSISANTDEYGKFKIISPRAITMLTVKRIGYKTVSVNVSENKEPLYIQMSVSPVQLTGVEVVGSMQLLQAQPIGVLTGKDLSRFSGLSLVNSINTIPGVFMQSRTPWGGARITIRGYYPSTSGNSPNQNGLGYQAFINDIPITDAAGTTVLDNIDFSSLGNVEVIKGPSSSLYGSFIGGTVLFTTSKPKPGHTSFSQQVVGGSNGLFRSTTTFNSAGKTSDFVVNYGHQTYDSFRPHSASNKDFFYLNGDFQVGTDQTVSTFMSINRSYEELAGEIDSADYYNRLPVSNQQYLSNNSHIKVNNFIIGVSDNYRISDLFTNKTTIFGSGFTSNQPFAHGVKDVNQFNYGLRTQFGYTVKTGSLGINGILGGMFQRSNLTSNGVFIVPAPPFTQRPSDQENYAMKYNLFTEWSFAFPGQITVTAGASFNKNEFGIRNMLKNNQVNDTTQLTVKAFDPVVTQRISVSKVFNNEVSAYLSVSTGYTPPLLSDAVASNGSVDLSLSPEKAVQYEAGTKGNIFDNKLAYQLSLFDLENSNKLVRQTANSVSFTTNAGKQRNQGLELSLHYIAVDNQGRFISLFSPWLSYTYSNFKYVDFKSDNNNNAGTINFSGNYVARVPRNMVSAGFDLETKAGFYIYGAYQYVDKVPVTFDNSTYVRAYSLLGAKAGYKVQFGKNFSVNIYAGGDNLLSSTYYTFLFVGPNIKGLEQSKDGGSGDGYIIPGSYKPSFYGNVTLSYSL